MKDRVKRLISFRVDRYRELEIKLEKMAAEGLLLEACSTGRWTFRRGEPAKLTYTVTYFSEGSLFNPDLTDNQQTYIEYAKAAGWDFVAQFNQMQIFCSAAEAPVPFETDEGEKLANIKKCMRKSFIPSILAVIVVFSLNLAINYSAFANNPIDFLSDAVRLGSVSIILAVVLYYIYLLVDYAVWCRRSARAIVGGGSCIESTRRWRRVVDMLFLCYIFGMLGLFILTVAKDSNWVMLAIGGLQMPIFIGVYWFAITYMKKKKVDAMVNRVMSFLVLIVVTFGYMALLMWLIIGVGIGTTNEEDYRTVTWELTATESREYKLYSDYMPLTCEDLFGPIDYDYYSYEAEIDRTIFVTRSSYAQDYLPGKDAPPRLRYEVVETKLDWVYRLARAQLVENPQWRETITVEPIASGLFGTVEAYQKHHDGDPTGQYILLLGDRVITIDLQDEATPEQITVIREKLGLY